MIYYSKSAAFSFIQDIGKGRIKLAVKLYTLFDPDNLCL